MACHNFCLIPIDDMHLLHCMFSTADWSSSGTKHYCTCLLRDCSISLSIIILTELQIYIKLPGDLGMSKKVKKKVVSTQCLAHPISLENCSFKSLVV